MKQEISYGIIPLRFHHKIWQVFLIEQGNEVWGFPKGNPALDETPQQTAERELHEEIGLYVVQYLGLKPFSTTYYYRLHGNLIHKTVQYFAAEVAGHITIQKTELKTGKWFSIDDAIARIDFADTRHILIELKKILAKEARE